MFRSRSTSTSFESSLHSSRFPLLDLLSVNSAISVLKSKVHPSSAVPPRASQPNPFGIRSSAKSAHNSFRMRSYKETRSGHPLSACANPAIAGTIRVLDPIILSSQEGARCDE